MVTDKFTGAVPEVSDVNAWARRVVRPLSRRYLLALIAVAVLVIVDQAIIQPQLVGLSHFAPTINLAGRQRMLSQRIAKDALALAGKAADGGTRRGQLLAALNQWNAAQGALLCGKSANDQILPVCREAGAILAGLEADMFAITEAATSIANKTDESAEGVALKIILARESNYLDQMEQVVAHLEHAAERQLRWLRGFGLIALAVALALLGGVYQFVLRPADRLIREQFQQLAVSDATHRELSIMLRQSRDGLELRVQSRTSELSTANAALLAEAAERKSAVERTHLLSAQLAHASRVNALGQLATGLAHEINQPLATITNYAESLELLLEAERPLGDRVRRAIVEMRQSALRAGAIVRRMRQFVRPGMPEMALVEVHQLTQAVGELCLPELRGANIELAIDETSAATYIQADGLQIQQVLVNLVQNALQAMDAAQSAARRIEIFVERHDEGVCIRVKDTGPGFSAGQAGQAFTPFFTTKPDGLGMGLAISRSIVHRHRGRMWAENCPGGGAVVAFTLPLDPLHNAEREAPATCVCG